MATRPELVEQLFEAALALKPAERKAFLREESGQDELRHTVKALLIRERHRRTFELMHQLAQAS